MDKKNNNDWVLRHLPEEPPKDQHHDWIFLVIVAFWVWGSVLLESYSPAMADIPRCGGTVCDP